MQILDQISSQVKKAIVVLYSSAVEDVKIEKTNPNFIGDLTIVVFPFLRISKKGPEQTAEEIGQELINSFELISSYNVVKGFLNLELKDSFWISEFSTLEQRGFQFNLIGQGKRVVVEYSSPNTNKPLHLGHIRNNVLGYSYSKILEANGYNVIKNNLVNDRGIHICKSMLAWQKFGNNETPDSTSLKGDHLVGKYYVKFDQVYKEQMNSLIAEGKTEDEAKNEAPIMTEVRTMLQLWEKGDPDIKALWNKMNNWVYEGFDHTYSRLGVSFDKIYYESETYLLGKDIILEGLKNDVFYQKEDGSIWVDLEDEGLDQKLLLRADGTSVYMTQDVGTAELKYQDFKMDDSVYVVGNEQDYHFKVLQLILKKLDRPHWKGIFHLSYGMVDLPSGKMKSREGTVVDADELMEEMVDTAKKQTEALGKTEGMGAEELEQLYETLGLGALKYFLLKVDAKKRMLFDPQESIDFQGNTGPFIQYTYSRIQSILRASGDLTPWGSDSLEPEEKEIIQLLLDYPSVLNEAASEHNPSVLTSYAYELAKAYNKFYHQQSILGAKNEKLKSFRVSLSSITGIHIEHACTLLGIRVPERM